MSWPCLWLEITGDVYVSFRRFVFRDEPSGHFHNATVQIARQPELRSPEGYISALNADDYLVDYRWPLTCECGYGFTAEDEWQVNQEPIYRAADGREWPARSLPVGAMLDATWNKPWGVGADGIALTVVLPPEKPDSRGQWWHVDGPSRNNGVPGPGWTRTGDPRNPPTLTVTPSILTSDYHGFLTAGVLTDPI